MLPMRNALYRVYRPQNFDEVEGQQHVALTLRNAAKEQQFAHAYLFTGTRGTGKTTMARIVAKAINCTTPQADGNPCNICPLCLQATQGTLVDLIEIDAASNNSVAQIRDIIDRARFQPAQAKKKVYIIDEVHMLSNSAANALLKTLEEPPSHVHFILATTEQHKILATIISRCQVFHFLPLSETEISARLKEIATKESINLTEDAVTSVARHANGGMRDALSILERLSALPGAIDEQVVDDILGSVSSAQYTGVIQALLAGNAVQALQEVQEAQARGAAPERYTRGLKSTLREQLLAQVLREGMTPNATSLFHVVERLESALTKVRYADIPWLHVELAILQIAKTSESNLAPTVHKQAAPPKVVVAQKVPASQAEPKPQVDKKEPKKETPTTPKPSTAEAPTTAPAQTTPATNEAAIQRLQKEWSSFTFKVPSVALRTALKATKVEGVENGELVLVCSSSIQFAHLTTAEHQKAVAEALEKHFALTLPLSLRLAQSDSPTQPSSPLQVPSAPEVIEEAPKTKEEEILKVADLFGGTITN